MERRQRGLAAKALRVLAAMLFAVLAVGSNFGKAPANETLSVLLRVQHEGRAIRGAKVFLLGAASHAQGHDVSDIDGEVRLDGLPEDAYQVRVRARGFAELVTSLSVDAASKNRFVLELSSELGVIGHVRAATTRAESQFKLGIDDDSNIRKIAPDLVDALGRLGGVSVGVSTSLATLSLRNKEPGATSTSFNGASVSSSVVANALDRDFIAAADVDQSRDAVDFLLLAPTIEPRYQAVQAYGAFGSTSTKITSQSTIGRIGLAVGATTRHAEAELNGRRYLDLSGVEYVHRGDFNGSSGFVRAEMPLPHALSLDVAYSAQRSGQEPIDSVLSASLPDGIGYNHMARRNGYLTSAAINGVAGPAGFVLSTNVVGYGISDSAPERIIYGLPSSTDLEGSGRSSTVQLSFGIPLSDRHSINGLAKVEASEERQSSRVANYSAATTTAYNRSFYSIENRWRPNRTFSLVSGLTSMRTDASISHGGFYEDITAKDGRNSYLLSLSSKVQPADHLERAGLSDPDAASFDCSARTVVVPGVGDASTDTLSTGASISWRRRLEAGSVALSAYDQRYSGVTLTNALIPANVSGLSGAYVQQVVTAYEYTGHCSGVPAVFASESLSGQTVLYRGVNVRFVRDVSRRLHLEATYDLQGAIIGGADARLVGSRSAYVPGSQLPNAPMHTAGGTIDQLIGDRTEFLTNVQIVDSNNARNLPKYALSTMALSHKPSKNLEINVIYSNVGDMFVSPYVSSRYAVPLATASGQPIGTLAAPLVRSSTTVQVRYRLDHAAPLF
jgi:hypothetical protein